MPKPSNRPTPFAAVLVAALVASVFAPASHASAQPPQVPATFFGSVSVDGDPVPPGTPVRAFVDGVDCTQPGGSGTFDEDGISHYLVDVMHETQTPGCGRTGAKVSFTVDSRPADVSAMWNSGPTRLDLFVGEPPASPPPKGGPAVRSGGGGRDWWLPMVVVAAVVGVAGAVTLGLLRKVRGNPPSTGSTPSS